MSNIWIDGEGRRWRVTLTFKDIREIKSCYGIDIGEIDMAAYSLAFGAMNAERFLASIMHCSTLVTEVGTPVDRALWPSADDVADAINGEVIESMEAAFTEAVTQFFPPKARPILARSIEQTTKVLEQLATLKPQQQMKAIRLIVKHCASESQEPLDLMSVT